MTSRGRPGPRAVAAEASRTLGGADRSLVVQVEPRSSPLVPALGTGPLLGRDATAAGVYPRVDTWSGQHPVAGCQRAAGFAVRALWVAGEAVVEEVVAHLLATSCAQHGRPVDQPPATGRQVGGVDVDAVAGRTRGGLSSLSQPAQTPPGVQEGIGGSE